MFIDAPSYDYSCMYINFYHRLHSLIIQTSDYTHIVMTSMMSVTKTLFLAKWLGQRTSRNEQRMSNDACLLPPGLGVQSVYKCTPCLHFSPSVAAVHL